MSGMANGMPMGGANYSMPPSSAPDHTGHVGSLSYTCDGNVWMNMGDQKAGSWAGHILPGIALLLWSLHWMHGVFRSYLNTERMQQSYRAQTTYHLPWLHTRLPIEGILKVVVPFFAILSELWWSAGHWRWVGGCL